MICPFCPCFCEATVTFAGLAMCEGCREIAIRLELEEDDDATE